MDVFGLTAVDSALSAWGLNCAATLIDLLFVKTPVGLVAFTVGFFWAIVQSARQGYFKHLTVFILLSLIGVLLFIGSKRQETTIKSAVEVYGTSALTAQSIRDSQTNQRSMPLMLSFFSQWADSISIGIINKVDEALNNQPHFLNSPFEIQRLSLRANQFINEPIADVKLRKKVEDFIYAEYLPSLIKGETVSLSDIQVLLKPLLDDAQGPWTKVKGALTQIGRSQNNIDNQIMASIVQGQCAPKQSLWLQWAAAVQSFFPYITGWANFCLYLCFPFLMLALIVFRRMNIFLRYLEVFVWVKSLILSSAVSYYISLIALRIQGQAANGVSWFWENPYYVAVASILLLLMPVLTFVGIHQSFHVVKQIDPLQWARG